MVETRPVFILLLSIHNNKKDSQRYFSKTATIPIIYYTKLRHLIYL